MHTISTCPQCGQEMHPTDYHSRLRAILLDSPSERLRRICDDLEKYKNNSPYSAGAWDELMEEKIRAKDEIARLRTINAELLEALENMQFHAPRGLPGTLARALWDAAESAIAKAQGEAA